MLDLIFLSPLLLVIVAVMTIRFCIMHRPLQAPGWVLLSVWTCIAFLLPLGWGVWVPDILFAPKRTLAMTTSTGGYSFRVVQYWNRADFYSTQLHVTSPDNLTKVVTLDGDDNKSWSVPIALDEANRIASVTLSGRRTIEIQW